MGGFFSLEKDPDVRSDARTTSGAASAPDDPGAASLAEAPVPAGQDGVGAITCVADAASDSSSDVARPTESSQSS